MQMTISLRQTGVSTEWKFYVFRVVIITVLMYCYIFNEQRVWKPMFMRRSLHCCTDLFGAPRNAQHYLLVVINTRAIYHQIKPQQRLQ